MTTILTLEMDGSSQRRFDALRKKHYPAGLNRIAGHLTLFHTLPATAEVRAVLEHEVSAMGTFAMRVSKVQSIGRGVAYFLESEELMALRGRLAREFAGELSAQDRQGFRPHVVVQNKVTGEEARELLEELRAGFEVWEVQGVGLGWWDYLDGPWALRERLMFSVDSAVSSWPLALS